LLLLLLLLTILKYKNVYYLCGPQTLFFFFRDLVPVLKTLLTTGLEPNGRC